MILEAAESFTGKPGSVRSSGIMDQLISMAHRSRNVEEAKPVPDKVVIDPEVDRKIRELRGHEDRGDLGWMDYDSVRHMPRTIRESFEKLVNPLYWGGFYFPFSVFNAQPEVIFSTLDAGATVYVLRDRGNFKIVLMTGDGYPFYTMGVNAFKVARQNFQTRCVMTLARGPAGICVERRFVHG